MRSSASVFLLLAACSGGSDLPRAPLAGPSTAARPAASQVPTLPPEAGDTTGPSGTSGAAARYDEVGYATWYGEEVGGNPTASGKPFDPNAITAAHRTLPLGSYAEVTALDTGRTILVLVNDRGPGRKDRLIDLSRGAAALLGTNENSMAPVRVRAALAAPDEASALAAGRPAGKRLDAPPALLAVLRRKLDREDRPLAPRPPRVASAMRAAAPVQAAQGAYLVQVAAFSNQARARALAASLNGRAEGAGGLWRVRLGPFPDARAAQRARDAAAKRGYGDATIIVQP